MNKLFGNNKGFTLLELIIVVIIIGILAAIALPQYVGFVERSRVAEAATALGSVKTCLLAYYAECNAWPVAYGTAALINTNLGINLNTAHWTYQTDNAGLITATRGTLDDTAGDSTKTITLQVVNGGPGTWGGTHPNHPR